MAKVLAPSMLMRFLKGSGLEKVVVAMSLPLTKVITGWSASGLLLSISNVPFSVPTQQRYLMNQMLLMS